MIKAYEVVICTTVEDKEFIINVDTWERANGQKVSPAEQVESICEDIATGGYWDEDTNTFYSPAGIVSVSYREKEDE